MFSRQLVDVMLPVGSSAVLLHAGPDRATARKKEQRGRGVAERETSDQLTVMERMKLVAVGRPEHESPSRNQSKKVTRSYLSAS